LFAYLYRRRRKGAALNKRKQVAGEAENISRSFLRFRAQCTAQKEGRGGTKNSLACARDFIALLVNTLSMGTHCILQRFQNGGRK